MSNSRSRRNSRGRARGASKTAARTMRKSASKSASRSASRSIERIRRYFSTPKKTLPVSPATPLGAVPAVLSAVSVVAANVGKKPVTAVETKKFPNKLTLSKGFKDFNMRPDIIGLFKKKKIKKEVVINKI